MHKRPVFLNLFQIRFPLTAIVSIIHRISGVLLFLCIPLVLIVFQMSLTNQESFAHMQSFLNNILIKISILLTISALIYHTLAGLRHIIMDLGIGDSKRTAKITSILVIIFTTIIITLVGIHLW